MSTPPPLSTLNAKDITRYNLEKLGVPQDKSISKDDPTTKFPSTKDFKHLIHEIDQDIFRFDHNETTQVDSSGPYSKLDSSLDSCTLPLQPIKLTALQDITNLKQAFPHLLAHEEKKWTSIQRPYFLSEDQTLDISFGKRLYPSSHDELTPYKHKAPLGNTQNDNLCPTASAALQPGRAQ
nr:hypothetical protein CFP56_50287 [Quercus suber]